jgi:hypothetical protein
MAHTREDYLYTHDFEVRDSEVDMENVEATTNLARQGRFAPSAIAQSCHGNHDQLVRQVPAPPVGYSPSTGSSSGIPVCGVVSTSTVEIRLKSACLRRNASTTSGSKCEPLSATMISTHRLC